MGLVTSAEATEAVMIVRSVPGVVRVIKVFEYF
jgi:osmotically-inducible protein OsmY